ncbi:hypothetical protein Tc00.1047053510013.180 [Trypanosoma cruzi]|uniref:Uncharacterized protein n=1 Tax=Trypanosoma cruzi (strain CL Brener) TaxID=353153 RepID=Q4DVX5_TRYCC|nr:hypothetical protein Tc00.1047053510013.180 [Trypanosoma cruzi]EAN96674.1 hypothetical protein Tc00.1047053510013.180 [Trypanosoma cruzi]|eukprot:XP_818525.1 hypothetical protein [Trypanosoma cruzi strain CL Brener]
MAGNFGHFPLAVEMSWGRWRWISSPPAWWVAAGVMCLPCVDAVSWCVNCAAGPAALSACCLLSLSLYPRCFVPLPLVAFFFFCLTDQLTDSSDSTTGDDDCGDDDGDGAVRCAPCWSLRSCAAVGSPGDVSGAADAVVVPVDVPVDVLCAPSGGSLSYRVRVCVCVGVEEGFCCRC